MSDDPTPDTSSSDSSSDAQAPSETASDFVRTEANSNYTDKDLQHLSDLDHVRERPSMYIGDTTHRGLHHLV